MKPQFQLSESETHCFLTVGKQGTKELKETPCCTCYIWIFCRIRNYEHYKNIFTEYHIIYLHICVISLI